MEGLPPLLLTLDRGAERGCYEVTAIGRILDGETGDTESARDSVRTVNFSL